MQNPYDILRTQGVPGGRTTVLPQNFGFDLTMDTWWSAVLRARNFSDLTGLDALYSYCIKSSTLIRAALDKRLRPLKARTYGVYDANGVEDERLTELLNNDPMFRKLKYNKGMSKFTYARVVGVEKDLSTYVYPLRNLDIVNKAVKGETYDTEGKFYVKSHVNLFWMQSEYDSEDTLGLLEPIARDYINAQNAQNDWQTASRFMAYQQWSLYYENGDEEMRKGADLAAAQLGMGKVLISGKTTDEDTGKVIKDYELDATSPGTASDTFRIYKENIDSLFENISLVFLGSSLLLKSAKNTNSERLVRAHLKGFYDACEEDAIDVQDWLNLDENKRKLAYLYSEPALATKRFKAKPSNYIDIGDIETYVKMLKDLGLMPTDEFVKKTGLDVDDVVGYEDSKNVSEGNKAVRALRKVGNAARNLKDLVTGSAKRNTDSDGPSDETSVGS